MRIILLAALFLYTPHLFACDEPLRVAKSGSGKFSAIEKLGRDILRYASCSVTPVTYVEHVTLDRRIALLVNGEIDLIIAVNRKPEREKGALFSIPFDEERIRMWTLVENEMAFSGKRLEELIAQGNRIIGPNNGWFGQYYNDLRNEQNPLLIRYTHVPNGLEQLLRDRGDVLLGSEEFAVYFPEEYKNKLVMLPQVVHRDGYHFMFSQKTVSSEIVEKINDAIREKSQDTD